MHLDNDPRKLYTVRTEGGGHSDGARCDTHVYNSPLSQDVLRSRSVGINSSNCCKSVCCSRIEI